MYLVKRLSSFSKKQNKTKQNKTKQNKTKTTEKSRQNKRGSRKYQPPGVIIVSTYQEMNYCSWPNSISNLCTIAYCLEPRQGNFVGSWRDRVLVIRKIIDEWGNYFQGKGTRRINPNPNQDFCILSSVNSEKLRPCVKCFLPLTRLRNTQMLDIKGTINDYQLFNLYHD